jgi:hypothetical protein
MEQLIFFLSIKIIANKYLLNPQILINTIFNTYSKIILDLFYKILKDFELFDLAFSYKDCSYSLFQNF